MQGDRSFPGTRLGLLNIQREKERVETLQGLAYRACPKKTREL